LWMALRFGPKGAAISSLAVSTIALLYAIKRHPILSSKNRHMEIR
jgi:hypothetical protein